MMASYYRSWFWSSNVTWVGLLSIFAKKNRNQLLRAPCSVGRRKFNAGRQGKNGLTKSSCDKNEGTYLYH